jgi:anti-sigma factor RsiW
MEHLTDEQFEDIMQGEDIDLTHLKQCQDCQNHLAEKQAIAARLRSAFKSVKANAGLVNQIRSQINQSCETADTIESIQHTWMVRLHQKLWPALATAAAILVVLVPLSLYFGAPPAARAAQAELVKIHNRNLSPDHEFYSDAEPEKLAEYFKSELGFSPAFPCTGHGMAILGCCVAHFRGQIVGSYVVDTPRGVISIIVVTDTPKSIGMNRMTKRIRGGQTCWKASFARCSMVTVRLGGYSYCAVGETSHKHLQELLSRLLPDMQQ